MKYKLIIGICILVLLIGCNNKSNIQDLAESQRRVGYQQGMNNGLDICESEYKPMFEQFIPPEGCMLLIHDKYTIEVICENDEHYNNLR